MAWSGDHATTLEAGVIALYSCSEGESSWEPAEPQHGVFFHFLIEGLQGKADLHHDGRITWTELVDYLVSNVDLYAFSRLPAPPPDLPAGVWEDFSKANVGSLPDGWTSSPLRNLSVQKNGEQKDLELTTPANGGDVAILPKADLNGNFYIEFEAQFPSEDTAVTLQLGGGPKVRPLAVQLDGHGKLNAVGVPTADLSKFFRTEGEPNVLGVERCDQGYVIKLNETQVGALPAAAGPGPYDTAALQVGLKDKDQKTPHINSVRVQPLP